MPWSIVDATDNGDSWSGGQQNSGGVKAASATATLPSPTTGSGSGNIVFLFLSANIGHTIPSGFTALGPTPGGAAPTRCYAKPSVDGETSWAVGASGAVFLEWGVIEVAGLDWDTLVDANPSSAATSTGTTASTFVSGTNSPSSTFDGMVIALFGTSISSAVAPSFSGWGAPVFELFEVSQVSATAGHGMGIAIGNTYTPTAYDIPVTVAPSASQTQGTHLVLNCAGAKSAPDLIFVDSAEQGTTAHSVPTGGANGLFGAAPTNLSCLAAAARSGSFGYRLSSTAAAASYQPMGFSANIIKRPTLTRYFRFNSLPSVDVQMWSIGTGAAAAVIRYLGATNPGHIGLKLGASAEVVSDSTVTAGQWFGVEFRFDTRTTTYLVDWEVDYNAELTDTVPGVRQTQTSLAGQAANQVLVAGAQLIGWSTSLTATMDTDDGFISNSVNAFPQGDLRGLPVFLDATTAPVVNGTVGNFALITNNATGATLTAGTTTTARSNLRDGAVAPPTIGATQNGVCQITAAVNDYLEFGLENVSYAPLGLGVRGLQILATGWAASATAGNIALVAHDNTPGVTFPECTVLGQVGAGVDANFDNSTTAPVWVGAVLRTSQQVRIAWTETRINGMTVRMGYSGGATPDQGFLFIMGVVVLRADSLKQRVAEVTGLEGVTGTAFVDARLDADSGAPIAYDATPAADFDAEVSYTERGTPTSTALPAGDPVATEIVGADTIDDVTNLSIGQT